MKFFKTLLIAMFVVAFAACNDESKSGYNPDTCKKLAELIEDGEELDEEEYSQMIDQFDAMTGYIINKIEEFNFDEEKFDEFLDSREGKKIDRYSEMFFEYLERNEGDLTKSQRKQLKAVKRKIEKKSKEVQKKAQKRYSNYDYDDYDDYGYGDY